MDPSSASDRNGGRYRLENCDFQRQAAFTEQDRLDRLGNTVAAYLLRTEARHQTDDQAADDGDGNNGQTHGGIRDFRRLGRNPSKPEGVGGDGDRFDQDPRAERPACADHRRQKRKKYHSGVGAMVGKLMAGDRPCRRKAHHMPLSNDGGGAIIS